jgi:putative endonuclease
MNAWLYILRLNSGQIYIGSTIDLDRRVEEHYSGHACRTTKLDPPVKLVYSESFPTFSEARKREAQIKRWTRAKKEALLSGDFTKLRKLSISRQKTKNSL